MIKKIFKKLFSREIIAYLIAGVLTTVVNLVVYRLFDGLLRGAGDVLAADEGSFEAAIQTIVDKGAAGIIAWVAAVAFAYITNRIFVFTERAHGFKGVLSECGKFLGARLLTGVIEILGVPLLVIFGLKAQVFGLDVAKLIVSVVVIILNYVFSKLFVFKGRKDKNPETVQPEENKNIDEDGAQ